MQPPHDRFIKLGVIPRDLLKLFSSLLNITVQQLI